METLDCVSLVLAAIKDKIKEETAENFRQSYTLLLEAEVKARRAKVQAQILEMAKLRIALEKFEKTYNQIKEQCGSIESVDNYLSDIRKRIQSISVVKNKPLSNRN